MIMSRRLKRFVGRMLIGMMVFAQMAIAAYACPSLLSNEQPDPMATATPMDMAMSSAAAEGSAMVGCDEMDNNTANLCAEHCRFGQQSADHSPAPTVAAALLTPLYTLPVQPESLGYVQLRANVDIEQVAAPPPHAILHCCFRI